MALEQAFEAGAVAGLVLGHLVDRVVDGVVAERLRALGEFELACARALLGRARSSRFFFVDVVSTSPSSSANFAACSASSNA